MRVTSRILALATAAVAVTVAAPAVAAPHTVKVRPLPNDREGVVLAYRVRSHTAIVAMRNGNLLAINSLRRVAPGSRVRVGGIKWGTPSPGIKWGSRPLGIKWGIKWSRAGTYSSSLVKVGNALRRTPVRGVVVRRYRNGVAIGTRGGVIVVRLAVWLPKGSKGTKGTSAIRPVVGDIITTNVRLGRRGNLVGDPPRIVNPANSRLPVAGRISRINRLARTIRITDVTADPGFGVHVDLKVPTTMDMSRIQLDSEVAADTSFAPTGGIRTDQIAPNTSFAAANDPANIQIAPPPASAAVRDLIGRAIAVWDAARGAGAIPDQVLYDVNAARLAAAVAAATDGNAAAARAELEAFIAAVDTAVKIGPGMQITPQASADVLSPVGAALLQL